MNTLEGTWLSHYEYGRGHENELQISEHRLEFVEAEGRWVGTSLPSDDGSNVSLTLTQNGSEFAGEWNVHTSPTGYYRGREFKGLVLFLMEADSMNFVGMWLGASSSNHVKTGTWTLKREVES